MTILSSRDGRLYDFPDGYLKKHEVPADKVKAILAEMDDGMDAGSGDVEPYGYGFYGHSHYNPSHSGYWRPYRRRRRHYYY